MIEKATAIKNRFFTNFQSKCVTIVLLLLIFYLGRFLFPYLTPLFEFVSLLVFPVCLTFMLYYIMKPVVDFGEKKKIPRMVTILALFLIFVAFVIVGLVLVVPIMEMQVVHFVENLPKEVEKSNQQIHDLLQNPNFQPIRDRALEQLEKMHTSIEGYVTNLSKNFVSSLGGFWQTAEKTLLGLIMTPFMLFYLLKDDHKVLQGILPLFPTKWRHNIYSAAREAHYKLSSYIRGQLIVALFITVLLLIGFKIVGVDYAITLSVVAGIMNFLIPSFGALIAMIPAILVAIFDSPWQVLWVCIIFYVVQHLQSHFIAPLVLGNQLNIHPVTILVLLLWAGKVFGFAGLVLVIPIYAVLSVVVRRTFEWWKTKSGEYEETESEN